LQEGLQLLEERRHEVDAIFEQARERALLIRQEAQLQARQITQDAEQQRAKLEEQLAGLRAELAEGREELARLRLPANNGEAPATTNESAPPPAVPAAAQVEATEPADGADAAGTPVWGRRMAAGPQAVRTPRSARPRWLPPWLPFVFVC
jgi:hypothetical protein